MCLFNSLPQLHHVTASHPPQVITFQSVGGRSERIRTQRTRISIPSSLHCLAASTVIPLLPKALFTPSIQRNLGLSRPRTCEIDRHQHPSSHTVLIHSLHVYKPSRCSPIHSTRLLHLYSSYPAYPFIPNVSIRITPTKFIIV